MPPSEFQVQFLRPILQRLKECIQKKQYGIRNTKKNRDTLAHFGWTIEKQESILLSLQPADCYHVDENLDRPDSEEYVYKFHKSYEGRLLYIKLTFQILIMPDGQSEYADIMSLHIDDYDNA